MNIYRAALTGVILANYHSFALSDHELGETHLVEHEIKVSDHTPSCSTTPETTLCIT